MVGGVVATDRHGPHADHGKDMVIIQASHVGYDPETKMFGDYCRLQTSNNKVTSTCGKINDVIQWYQEEYQFAQENIYLALEDGVHTITIDNQLLDESRSNGLFLDLECMVMMEDGKLKLQRTLSTSRVYVASREFCKMFPEDVWSDGKPVKIGNHLVPELFAYRRQISGDVEGRSHLESNLLNPMPWIVTSPSPLLVAAQINTQAEFDRTFRSIVKAHEYMGKKLLFISCLNIDISPKEGQLFPLTKCVPWAAYIQNGDGSSRTLEQPEIVELLMQQSTENPDQIDMEAAIQQMIEAQEIKITI